ncbi:MAG: DUF6240 domain-containing protein [Lachnospiraceae bacterium]|nr:DUF6240 domain-containing protein [Lachnospiraceae bacterium]
MSIAINQIDAYEKNQVVKNGHQTSAPGTNDKVSKGQAVFAWDHSQDGIGMQAYRDNDNQSSLLDKAVSFDEKNSKDYMVVMSNTMSDEDYCKWQENGGNPGDCEPGEMVTIMDQIKITLAKAGVEVSGFTDQLDAATIKDAGLSEGYANAIANALKYKNLPATEDNIKSMTTQMTQMQNMDQLSDGARKYLIENELPPTFDNLYKANYTAGKETAVSQGYYETGTSGYMAKKGAIDDVSTMESQIRDIIRQSGLEENSKNMENATWLLEKGLPLTEKNLHYMANLDSLACPLDVNQVALAAADAVSMGLSAKEGNLIIGNGYPTEESGYLDTSIEIYEKTQAVSNEDLLTVIKSGNSLNLYNLFQAVDNLQKTAVQTENEGEKTGQQIGKQIERQTGNQIEQQQKTFMEAKKQLVQIQLTMSVQANLKLLKHGISIDLEPLNHLVKMLEKEESLYHATELGNIVEKTEEIKNLPQDTLGVSVQEAWMANRVYTLDHVYETGKNIAADYEKAGQSYEALMTSPRADLGDHMKKAFQNVDDLLLENGLEVSDENRKATRILGYNRMEITQENLDAVKEAEALLTKVVQQLTPEKTLHMLRDGINPMEINLDELSNYLDTLQDEGESLEKYSKYLYRLEKNKEISQEEKDAYIGVYRLLRQIEKGDDAAIGTLVSKNQEMNFDNLLSAVRTRKKGFIDTKIDDACGLLKEVQNNQKSISDQIMNYYKNRAGRVLHEMSVEGFEDFEEQKEFYQSDLAFMRQMKEIPEDTFTGLIQDGIVATANHLMAEQMISDDAAFVKDYRKILKDRDKEKEFLDELEKLTDSFDSGKESVQAAYEAFAKRALQEFSDAGEESKKHIDVRSFAFDMRQVSLWGEHAKQESYYVPMQLSEHVTMVHVKVVNGDKKGTVTVDLKENDGFLGKARAVFQIKEGKVEGLLQVADEKDLSSYREIAGKCCGLILEKTGKSADITCVQSQTMNLNAFHKDEKTESTKDLYQIAKAFIQSVEQEVTAYESQL